MKTKGILLAAVLIFTATGLAQSQSEQLSGTVDVTYLSNYIWRGFDYYPDDDAAIQPSVDIDLYGTGFGVKVLWSRALEGGHENAEQLDFSIYYAGSVNDEQNYATNYKLGWVYYGFPDEPRSGSARGTAADMQEAFLSLAWPKICPAGFVPSYSLIAMWPSEGKSTVRNNAGMIHVLGLGYDLQVAGMTAETPEQTLHLSAELVYNDGAGPGVVPGAGTTGSKVDHDWSHMVLGVATDFDCGNNLTFTPAVYWQNSMDDSVNNEDELWVSLSMKYAF